MKNRLFIALKLPDEIKKEIVSIREKLTEGDIQRRWEPVEKLHMTLKFLGDVDVNKNNEIENILDQITKDFSKIECEYDRFGFFMPRILWLSLKAENHLFKLVDRINFDLEKLDFEPEKRNFKAHITLLRIKENLNPDFVERFKSYKMPLKKFSLNEVSLMESRLQKSGSIYTDLKSYNLK